MREQVKNKIQEQKIGRYLYRAEQNPETGIIELGVLYPFPSGVAEPEWFLAAEYNPLEAKLNINFLTPLYYVGARDLVLFIEQLIKLYILNNSPISIYTGGRKIGVYKVIYRTPMSFRLYGKLIIKLSAQDKFSTCFRIN
jgi:hypothetical protein